MQKILDYLKHAVITNWRTATLGVLTGAAIPVLNGQLDAKSGAMSALAILWGIFSKDANVTGSITK